MKKTSNEYELEFWPKKIIGIDEAGRGPIAGPLVVCGVVLPVGYENDEIYDSKSISEKQRIKLFELIKDIALDYKIKIVSIEEIDSLNIYQATKKAMYEIASELDGEIVLTDAMSLNVNNKKVLSVIKGDTKSINIAAASILAKVTRDKIMCEYDSEYPEYGFKKNKGYPTKAHLEALDKYGVLDIHRKSYGPVLKKQQLTLDI